MAVIVPQRIGGDVRGDHWLGAVSSRSARTHGWADDDAIDRVAVSFFFQAEDGIRDLTVTGVQTCALPIFWTFPTARDRGLGRQLVFDDDTFVEPGGKALVTNEEDHGDILSIDIKTHRLTRLDRKSVV